MNNSTNLTPCTSKKETIQETVYRCACRATSYENFDIHEVLFIAYVEFGKSYSYKQVRDALYRTREKYGLEHWFNGKYHWLH